MICFQFMVGVKILFNMEVLEDKCDLVFKKDTTQQAMLGCGINSGSGVRGTVGGKPFLFFPGGL